ncbi:MAG: DUF4019 domain-containing protein [Brachymonas sp.]|nr:DUF4019 domain-containing protein [Brachymonas sp.]
MNDTQAPIPASTDPGPIATQWLAASVANQAQTTWEQAAPLFQLAISREQWAQSLAATRTPLGRMLTRQETSRTHTQQLPGAPDGQYCVLQYASSFTHKAQAVETVTLQGQPDGSWRVVGYFIQ